MHYKINYQDTFPTNIKFSNSNSTFFMYSGHFTAMVWRATERFGLGEEGQAGGNFYVVAGYDPKPNMKGGYEENVHRLSM